MRKRKLALKLHPHSTAKIGEIDTLTVRFPQVLNPLRAKESAFFDKISWFFHDLLKFLPLQCI